MKIPFNEEETLNYIDQEELFELSWLERQFRVCKYKIMTTEELSKQYRKDLVDIEDTISFKPFQFKVLIFSIVSIILASIIINAFLTGNFREGFLQVIFFLIVVFAMGVIAVNFDPARNLKIDLSKKGISINELKYQWGEIYRIYIVERRAENIKYFLILAFDSGVTHRHEFSGLMPFENSARKLSAYIEVYRNFA